MSDRWYLRTKYWNYYLFKSDEYVKRVNQFWIQKHDEFMAVLNSIDAQSAFLSETAKNNFRRWNILKDSSTDMWKNQNFSSYNEAVSNLKKWLSERIQWIDNQLKN